MGNIEKFPDIKYKILDHTADIGLEAYGNTAKEAFIHAANGMFAILANGELIHLEKTFSFEIEADSPEELLVAWLNKLLYLYDAERVILGNFEILNLEQKKLSAKVSGEPVDLNRHKIRTYIKAATYHRASVEINDICTVRVIFDV